MFCHKCGKVIQDDSVFCRYCGANVELKSEVKIEPVPEVEKIELVSQKEEQPIIENESESPEEMPIIRAFDDAPLSDKTNQPETTNSEIYNSPNSVSKSEADKIANPDKKDLVSVVIQKIKENKKKVAIITAAIIALIMIIACFTASSNYKKATSAYIKEDYDEAYKFYKKSLGFRDSKIMANEALFKNGLKQYNDGEYEYAFHCFYTLTQKGYLENNASTYMNASGYGFYGNYTLRSYLKNERVTQKEAAYIKTFDNPAAGYKWLIQNIGFDGVNRIIVLNRFIEQYLLGEWKESGGSKYIKVTADEKGYLSVTQNFSVPKAKDPESTFYFDFRSGKYWITNMKGEGYDIFMVFAVDENTIDIYEYETEKGYRLYRQS